MRKYNFILMAFALLLGMAQCKKEPATPNGDNNGGVRITLKVDDDDNGEKLNVYPATGAVIFTQGDKIYVGNNGKYVGTLTFDNGLFQGTVSGDLSTNDYLHFYFVGNKPTSPSTLTSGNTTYTVDISDQSTGLPAISYAPSTAKYSPSTTAYTAKLLNKSALVKFVPSMATTQPITVSGLNNEVQIDFANHTLAPTGTTGGITLFSAGDSEKWAVLLEQASLSDLNVSGSGFEATIDEITLPEGITNNMYYNSGIGISMTTIYQTYEANSSNWLSVLGSFNAEPTPNPILVLTGDITINGEGSVISRANGTLNLNGHTIHWSETNTHALFLRNNVLGESLTIKNGTIEAPVDGNIGWSDWYCGTVIFEDITFKREVFFDGHLCELTNVNFAAGSMFENYTGGSGNPGLVIINSGKFNCAFHANGNYATKGLTTIYGGKFSTNPSSIANVTIPEGYTIKSNTDSDSGTYPWVVSALPEGALKGEFTINASGDKVYFSKGNLQYIGSAATPYWKFADNQWGYLGNNGQGSTATNVDRDLFGYGTSGYDNGQACWQPYSTTANAYYSGNLSGNADWGYNAIHYGAVTIPENSGWRTPSKDEWVYVFNTRSASTVNGVANARYAMATVNNVKGIMVFPDVYTHPAGVTAPSNINVNNAAFSSNNYTGDDWTAIEANGVLFLPAAGYRQGTAVYQYGSFCDYWSSSYKDGNYAYLLNLSDQGLRPDNYDVSSLGLSVRLVHNAQ